MNSPIQLILIFILSSCSLKSPFLFSSDYRQLPIAVDCDHASDVSLLFQKEGMPTLHIDAQSVEYKIITNDKGQPRPICIFEKLNLIDFCKYKGPDEVGPYWVPAYQKINTVKCIEILK